MKLKAYAIIAFSYLRFIVLFAIYSTFLHLIYSISKTHAILLLVLNLTFLVTEYSIKLIGRDYLNEFYTKISEDKDGEKR